MKKLFLGLMAAACILTSCDKVEELANELTDNQEPTMVESKDGLKTTVSFKVGGVVEYSFVVEYEVAKGDTICKMATTTEKYFLQEMANKAWEEVLASKDIYQDELDRINEQIKNTEDPEMKKILEEEAASYRKEIEDFDINNKLNGKTITIKDPEVAGLPKKAMQQTLTWTLEQYKKMYKQFQANS